MQLINDNNVTKNNIKSFLKLKKITLTNEEIQKVVMDYDINNNSDFDFDMFLSVLKNVVEYDNLPHIFRMFDKNNDDLITRDELRDMLFLLSYEDITLKDASDLIKKVTNDDKGITYNDFEKMILM